MSSGDEAEECVADMVRPGKPGTLLQGRFAAGRQGACRRLTTTGDQLFAHKEYCCPWMGRSLHRREGLLPPVDSFVDGRQEDP
ncbi:MAG TPA: hypothetical protein VGR26_04185 [Acidimicrobiales bacterium]|nr:hypothetical protein [Acidimicrobiales bacterium]